MARTTRLFGTCIALALTLALAGCSDSSGLPDGGGDINPSATCPNGVDNMDDAKSARSLKEGDEASDYICPAQDKDFYRVTLPAGKKMLNVKLNHTVTLTNLDLTYFIRDPNDKPIDKAPPWTGSGIRTFDAYHCLPGAGDYIIWVQDDGDDDYDKNNPYKLTYTTAADPDTNEGANGNNTMATAVPITTTKGYIACTGDVDYYKVNVPANKLLEVTLSTAKATPVDLTYTIYDTNKKVVGDEVNKDGTKAPTNIKVRHGFDGGGTFYIAVKDYKDDDSDPKVPYTLSVKLVNEPDPNEQNKRNDHPSKATVLGTFGCSGSQNFTKKGAIASKADVDYYKINMGKCGVMPVMEVTVSYGGSSLVDPQVGYIYLHKTKTCTTDSCCLVTGKSCKDFRECLRITTECVAKGDTYCNNKTCVKNPSLSCPSEKECAGAVVCVGGKCGVEQAFRADSDGSKGGAFVRTAQPLLHGGPWYIRVSDNKNDDYDNKQYTLTVRVRSAPDGAKELDSEYFSETVSSSFGIKTIEYHAAQAAKKATKLTLGTAVTGHLSYEGDQDWFWMDWPCAATSSTCTLKATWQYTGSGCPKGSKDTDNDGIVDDGLEFAFFIRDKDSKAKAKDGFPSKPVTGAGGSFGHPSKCFLWRGSSKPKYYIQISDMGHNMWSWSCGYKFTLTKGAEGCPVPPCKVSTDGTNTCYVP